MTKTILSSLLITLSLILSSVVSAQTSTLDDCFDYYKFQSVQVSVGADEDTYKAGDTASFSGELVNQNTYPVVDGNVFVRISAANDNFTTEGHYAVDELLVKENIAIDASSTQPISFTWKVPTNLKKGEYRADYFFSVGKQFNLGGLPFTNEIIVGFDTFTIDSTDTSSVFLDRAGTKVNGIAYQQVGNWPQVEPGSKVTISQSLKNTTNSSQTVSVSYDLYYWDSLNPSDLISSKTETVTLAKGQGKTLTFEIPKVEKSVYYLRIKALTDLGAQSILNVRLSSQIESPRINYFAVTGFPLKKGEQAKIFSCFHNTSYMETEGKVTLRATDIKGNEVANIQYTGPISSAISAKAGDLSAVKDLTYLKLDQTLYGKDGSIIEQKSEVYDCSTLKSEKCIEMTSFNFFIPIAIVALIFLLLSLYFIKRNKNLSLIFLAIAIVFAVMGAMLRYVGTVGAETTSGNGKVKTQTVSGSYGWYKGTGDDKRLSASGGINLTHTVTLSGNLTLNPGETISFSREKGCSFNATGGTWDTPYCDSAISFTDFNDASKTGSVRLAHSYLSMSVTSANSNKLNCSGLTCTAQTIGTSPQTVNVTATISGPTITGEGWVNTDGGSVCEDGTYDASACGGTLTGTHKMNLYQKDTNNPLSLSSYTTSAWTITIRPPLSVSCSASPTAINTGGSSTWTSTVTGAGGSGTYTYSWTGTDSLGGQSDSVSKTYSSVGSKTASVTVTSAGQSATVQCSNSVTVTDPGSNFTASCSNSVSTVAINTSMTRTASASGGNGTYSYLWSGDEGLSGTGSTISKSYSSTGSKTASVVVTSGTENYTASCPNVTVTSGDDPGDPGNPGEPGCTVNMLLKQCGDCVDNDGNLDIDADDPQCIPGSLSEFPPIVTKAVCGTQDGQVFGSAETSWPSGTFCEEPAQPSYTPVFPEPGTSSLWTCITWENGGTLAVEGSEKDCSAETSAQNVAPVGSCWISQADAPVTPPGATTTSIYVNKTATMNTMLRGFSSYTWYDYTTLPSKVIGSGINTSKIFTSIGLRKIKLVAITGEEATICTTSAKVIQKPTDVIEQ